MSFSFLQLARMVLSEEKRPLTVNEIWEIAARKGYEKQLESKGKTPWATLGARLHVEVRDNPASDLVAVGRRPMRFSLRPYVSASELTDFPSNGASKAPSFLEKDLHPFLSYFGFYYLKAYLKTVRHSISKKKEFGEWVHPDVVGCYFPFSEWSPDVTDVSALMGNSAARLFSFELKRALSLTNIREAFFQAVSNSSWANEGYLAAAEIDHDEDFRSELSRLSTAFGIGVIRLDVEDPDASEVIFPARPKDTIDWETVNKLSGLNQDFHEFLRRVKIDTQSKEVRREMYDAVAEKDQLIASISRKS